MNDAAEFDRGDEAAKSAKKEVELLALIETLTVELASAKKAHAAQQALTRRILLIGENALKEQQSFLDNAKAKAKGDAKAAKRAAAKQPAMNGHATNLAWRDLPIKEAIQVGAVVNAFEKQDPAILTLGQMSDWLNRGNSFDRLPGVGEEKQTLASDQLAEFWKANPAYCEQS